MRHKRIMMASSALASLPAQGLIADVEIDIVFSEREPVDIYIYDHKDGRISLEKPKRTHPTSYRKQR